MGKNKKLKILTPQQFLNIYKNKIEDNDNII